MTASIRNPDSGPLFDMINRILELKAGQTRISPSWVATEAWGQLDPNKAVQRAHPLIYIGCHLQLRQIARELLRKDGDEHKDKDKEEDQLQLRFVFKLQVRYPSARSKDWDEPEYILLEALSSNDVRYNVARLRKEGRTKLRHADALAAWGREHFTRSGRKRANAPT